MKTGTALFLIALLAFAFFYKEPPASEVVSVSRLEEVAKLAQQHPDQAAPYLQKIKSATFTRADDALLKSALAPIDKAEQDMESQRIKSEAPMLYWLSNHIEIIVISLFAVAGIWEMIRLLNAEPGERTFFGVDIG